MKHITITMVTSIMIFSLTMASVYAGQQHTTHHTQTLLFEDLDPLVDIAITVDIQKIRSLEKNDNHVHSNKKIDLMSDPDFYVKVFINDVPFTSTVWRNTKYIDNPEWSATLNVPDEQEFVTIQIQLWDENGIVDKRCDISSDFNSYEDSFDIELTYSLKTGLWWGDDYVTPDTLSFDPSGYGRLNGCDDGSIYERGQRDCELWFDIYQTDYDSDGIPYWTEVNIYGTDPMIDNGGEDADNDGCPIEWEHHYGHGYDDWYGQYYWWYDPFIYNDHAATDLDNDGLDNVEEYLTWEYGSDPFRKDVFIELDYMAESPMGESSALPEESKELLRTAFNRQNIVYHLDDGSWKNSGSDVIPFDAETDNDELQNIYWNYFLEQDPQNWRRGVFHYGLIVYNASYPGFVFWGGVEPYLDCYQISSKGMEKKVVPNINRKRTIVYASAYMHEFGHTLGIFNGNTPGCDDSNGKYWWQPNWWKWRPYKSVMNYGYMYLMVDYSDGSRGRNDFDDWNRIDLTFFQNKLW